MENNSKVSKKKIFSIVSQVLMFCFLGICLVSVTITTVSGKSTDGAVSIFGMQMRIVVSDSMAKHDSTDVSGYDIKDIPIKSMVFIETAPKDESKLDEWYKDIAVGDVLTFRYVYVTQETITHRVIDKQENANGGYTFTLEGDNKSSNADTLTQTIDTSKVGSPNYIIGKVVGQSRVFGFLISAIKSPVGIICIVIIPCLIIAILEAIKLYTLLTADKRAKERAEKEAHEKELEEMRRLLQKLQKQSAAEEELTEENSDAPAEDIQNSITEASEASDTPADEQV